jgi:hypothetical protein
MIAAMRVYELLRPASVVTVPQGAPYGVEGPIPVERRAAG